MSEKKEGWFEKTDRVIVKVVKTISIVSAVCLVGIMLVAFFNVLGEKIFHKGIPASTELIQYLHVPVVFLAAAYVTLDMGHTRIDLLSKKFPEKVQKACLTFGDICATGICIFIGYTGFIRLQDAIAHHTKSSVTGVGFALWPFILIFSVGFIMLAITFAWSIVRRFAAPSVQENEEGGNA